LSKLVNHKELEQELNRLYERICCVKRELEQCSVVEGCFSSKYVGPGTHALFYDGNDFLFGDIVAAQAYPTVNTFADLPLANTVTPPNNIYLVLNTTGTWFINRKERGLYSSDGVSWTRLGDVQSIFVDDTFQIKDNVDPGKVLHFNVDLLIGPSLKYFQDGTGTVAELKDIPSVSIGGNTLGTATILQTGTVVLQGGSNITLSQSQNGVSQTLSILGKTDVLGTATAQSNVTWTVNTSGISLDGRGYAGTGTSATNASITLNSNGLAISVAAPGGAQNISTWFPYFPASVSSQTLGVIGVSTASAFVYPIVVVQGIQFNHIKFLQSLSYVSSTIAGSQTISSVFGLYSNNAGTLSQISSGSMSFAVSNFLVSATLRYPSQTNSAGYTYTTLEATTPAQAQSLFGSVGNRIVEMVFGNTMSLSQGIYWLGIHQRQSTAGYAGGLSTAFIGNAMNSSSAVGPIGQSTAQFTSNSAFHLGAHGVYSSTGSVNYSGTNLPVSMMLTAFNNSLNVVPLITFMST
jgi:hypothetical protein